MEDTNKLVPFMNQAGFYEVIHIDEGKVPTELTNQVWTSERETKNSITAFLDTKAKEKETIKEKV